MQGQIISGRGGGRNLSAECMQIPSPSPISLPFEGLANTPHLVGVYARGAKSPRALLRANFHQPEQFLPARAYLGASQKLALTNFRPLQRFLIDKSTDETSLWMH